MCWHSRPSRAHRTPLNLWHDAPPHAIPKPHPESRGGLGCFSGGGCPSPSCRSDGRPHADASARLCAAHVSGPAAAAPREEEPKCGLIRQHSCGQAHKGLLHLEVVPGCGEVWRMGGEERPRGRWGVKWPIMQQPERRLRAHLRVAGRAPRSTPGRARRSPTRGRARPPSRPRARG